jgi:hypothetical protein
MDLKMVFSRNLGRTSSDINELKRRVAFLEKENGNREREIKDSNSQIDLLTDSRIIEMLQETSPYNHKPRYSYDEISIVQVVLLDISPTKQRTQACKDISNPYKQTLRIERPAFLLI